MHLTSSPLNQPLAIAVTLAITASMAVAAHSVPAVAANPDDPANAAGTKESSAVAKESSSVGGEVLFFDDFDGGAIDTDKWFPGLHQWGSGNNGVVPENLSVETVSDNGQDIGVLVAQANGEQYDGPIRGVKTTDGSYDVGDPRRYTRQDTGALTGGLVWTQERFGAGRYEVRMKNLPRPGGCSCIWNYYEPGGDDYTEIDIEMPASGKADRSDWARWAGLNSYISPDAAGATYQDVDLGFDNNDGEFHTYRWDWYDGVNGPKRIEFYVDGTLYATQTETVPVSPAQLWVGNWPAPWSGDFDYGTQYQYIDWVKISTLGDGDGGATGQVGNGGFEGAEFSPWTCTGNAALVDGAGIDSSTAARLTPTETVTSRCEQTVTGLTPGETYVLAAQLRTDGDWIYVGHEIDGISTERGTNADTYTTVSVPRFTAPADGTAIVYISAWRQQTTHTFADEVALVPMNSCPITQTSTLTEEKT